MVVRNPDSGHVQKEAYVKYTNVLELFWELCYLNLYSKYLNIYLTISENTASFVVGGHCKDREEENHQGNWDRDSPS